jgi:type VI secretion system protein ImpJ
MFKAEKILWGEGLFLRPQHFQLQDTYHEQRLNHTIRSTIPFPYGIKIFNLMKPAFHTYSCIKSINIIWQDGEIYHAPHKICCLNQFYWMN